jgi:hypothetical protein
MNEDRRCVLVQESPTPVVLENYRTESRIDTDVLQAEADIYNQGGLLCV